MGLQQGLKAMMTITGGTDILRVQSFIDQLPDPDVAPSQQKVAGYLDQMSPMCAAQLRVELAALKAVVT